MFVKQWEHSNPINAQPLIMPSSPSEQPRETLFDFPENAPKRLAIAIAKEEPLTKEQKRFNQLVHRIKKLRQDIEDCDKIWALLHQTYLPLFIEAQTKVATFTRQMLLALHESPWRKSLSKKLRTRLSDIMCQELYRLLGTKPFAEDAVLQALYEEYDPKNLSFEEARDEADQWSRAVAADMARNMFGVNLKPEDIDDEEKVREHFEKMRQDIEADIAAKEAASAARKASRKKSAKQLEAEARQMEAESALKKTTRQIYLDLVKHYHPDREQDETLRMQKNEWMKQITAAYEAGDQLKLLELQMTLLSERGNVFADFDETHLKHFNKSLQDQSRELEADLHFRKMGHPGDFMANFFHPKEEVIKQRVQQELNHMDQEAAHFKQLSELFPTSKTTVIQFIQRFNIDEFGDGF